MIPRKLTLKNFLSYRSTNLDFNGLHTACICGANGAGKSSLLEAITWVVWGKTRTVSDDDIIHLGEKNTRVDFEFIYNKEYYRIIRTRQRKGSGTLDFQIVSSNGYKSLSGKGLKDTQDNILNCLKIDYDTFINSAYLRQGRADEFMLRKPAERKKILADLLKLEQYEKLAESAKDSAKQYKIRSEEIARNLEDILSQLEEKQAINLELENTEKDLQYLQLKEEEKSIKLKEINLLHSQRDSLHDRVLWQRNQLDNIIQRIKTLETEKMGVDEEINKLNIILEQKSIITEKYQDLQDLRVEDQQLNDRFQIYQNLLTKKQKLEENLREESNNLILNIQKEKTNLENLIKQQEELEKIVIKTGDLTTEIQALKMCRERLKQLDEIQKDIVPFLQQQQNLKTALERELAKLEMELERIKQEEMNLHVKLAEVPKKRQDFFNLEKQLKELENKKNYQKRVQEKGESQKSLIEIYLNNQKTIEKQIEKLHQKLDILNQDHAVCPLCDRELDDNHLTHVIMKTREEEKQLESESWHYKTEKRNCERELEKLRLEYGKLNQELVNENILKQSYIKLENQLDSIEDIYNQYEKNQAEKEKLTQLLTSGNYAPEIQQQLLEIQNTIESFNYNEKDHALLRQEESNLRKVEYQQLKIKDVQNDLNKLLKRKPELDNKINELELEFKKLTENSSLQLKINEINREIQEINYDSNYHQNIRQNLQQLQSYEFQYLQLQEGKKQHPQLEKKLQQLTTNLDNYQQEKLTTETELKAIEEQLSSLKDYSLELQTLQQQWEQYRKNIDDLFRKKGGLEQSLATLKDREKDRLKLEKILEECQKNYRIYQELSIAFGKNGIQSLMIENILPQLETEANNLLARLTGSQLHVQFLTQKPKARSSKSASLKDTLDIIIADSQGTRSYETYSGGEAFRINFAIRLAISRILAQRSGTPLQLLIVDEGFGTQDSEGCDRLIAALNAIAEDFACILTVTHMPQFKEAFQTRIEVYKTEEGSKIRLST
ncbi:exonuclease subunit SbcC [Geminocystis sp. NIES-3709]|uniref:exonuclease subunit SbcC n=1 Tax=Geminocystis sp. NIES-3709 TaxID=1617448 RepID=UPI0005FCB941|nr:exonuclease subunit SbcC [Geminocystis sp. NIES-3709]BAQ64832.1 exonuclease SbcC [Geminocystis sp. NIES-3709]